MRTPLLSLLRATALTVALSAASGALAQGGAVDQALLPTRAQLEATLAQLEAAARVGSSASRSEAMVEAERVRVRLRDGDMRAGDAIEIQVEGEEALNETFTVAPGPVLQLPLVGDLPLAGVLRSEVPERVRAHVARRLRDPVVRTRVMVRLAVLGQVRSPGFYAVPATAMVSDAIMLAGGPLPTARLNGAQLKRDGAVLWDARNVRMAVAEGLSLDRMSVHSGDQLVVPETQGSATSVVMRAATTIPAVVIALVGLVQLM